jgi:hypothetical protein
VTWYILAWSAGLLPTDLPDTSTLTRESSK